MNWKGHGTKPPWPNVRNYTSICEEGLKKTTKPLSRDSCCPGQDSNRTPPEYNSEAYCLSHPARYRSNTGIMGSNFIWSMDVFLCISVFVFLLYVMAFRMADKSV